MEFFMQHGLKQGDPINVRVNHQNTLKRGEVKVFDRMDQLRLYHVEKTLNSVRLSWTKGADRYALYTVDENDMQNLVVETSKHSYEHKNLIKNRTYRYQVTATDACGSRRSNIVEVNSDQRRQQLLPVVTRRK